VPSLPKRKVGLIACSGEDLPEGTVSRIATLKVLEELRPGETVTLCLPLYLAGEERERAFARFYPTIAVDGCDKRCAARATERYSATPAASMVITDLIAAQALPRPESVRHLDAAGEAVMAVVADALAAEVDRLLGRHAARSSERAAAAPSSEAGAAPQEMVVAACSCGSGIPVGRIVVDGRTVELVALPSIFELFRGEGRAPGEDTAAALFDMVGIYNAIPATDGSAIREAVLREYVAYWGQAPGSPSLVPEER
jgi:hypothetical protein